MEKKAKINFVLLNLFFLGILILAILKREVIGSIISFPFIFLFGRFYFVIILIIFIILFLKLIKVKIRMFQKFRLLLFFSFFILFFSLFSSSLYLDEGIRENLFYYLHIFSKVNLYDQSYVTTLEGGFLGILVFSLLSSIFSDLITTVFLIFVCCFLFLFLFYNYAYKLMHFFTNFVKKSKQNKGLKEERKKAVTKQKEKLTFDIFNKPLFDQKVENFGDNNSKQKKEIKKEIKKEDEKSSNDKKEKVVTKIEKDFEKELSENANINKEKINEKLRELKIDAKVSDFIIGPCVTRYEIIPKPGVRVGSISNVENDLKLALAAYQTRMEAPIPGKAAVGLEVANTKRIPVNLKDILDDYKEVKSKLLLPIGKDLNNESVALEINELPHLLIAGATGSGKSVCLNSIILSLIKRSLSSEVKLLLIDPKKVELSLFENIPHLLSPIVKDPKKAARALQKVVEEMEDRYDKFSKELVRNIDDYNKKKNESEKLPYIVVIIDELADLMLVASKQVEDSIQRITQLARAAGIYLIVATQRPSVDVITGIIKANIPSRIAFLVSSSVDSRTILDKSGAEKLLGKGDMLLELSGSNMISRIQGAFVSDEEIIKQVEYLKNNFKTNFNEEFLNLDSIENSLNGEVKDDPLYFEAKEHVINTLNASTSSLQTKFAIGYARAARIMQKLENNNIVSSPRQNKGREVIINKENENGEN